MIFVISVKVKGDFNKTLSFLENAKKFNPTRILEKYGKAGVIALSQATPVDSGETASSWYYEVKKERSGYILQFGNSNVVNGVPIAIILQYGHGTKNGGYVQGRDYINPTIQPLFDKMADDLWKEVRNK